MRRIIALALISVVTLSSIPVIAIEPVFLTMGRQIDEITILEIVPVGSDAPPSSLEAVKQTRN